MRVLLLNYLTREPSSIKNYTSLQSCKYEKSSIRFIFNSNFNIYLISIFRVNITCLYDLYIKDPLLFFHFVTHFCKLYRSSSYHSLKKIQKNQKLYILTFSPLITRDTKMSHENIVSFCDVYGILSFDLYEEKNLKPRVC